MIEPEHLATLNKCIKKDIRAVSVTGLSGTVQSYFFSLFLAHLQKPCLIILPQRKEAEKLYKELLFFMSGRQDQSNAPDMRLFEFPPYDLSPLTGLSPHRDVLTRRIQALYALMSDENPVIITSLDAVSFSLLPKEAFVRSLEYLEVGEEVDRDLFLKRLEITGYNRSSLVEEAGDYAVRGGVVDLFPPLYQLPVRLEFWGDHLESIRQFDSLSQRSQNHLKEMVLLPANEIIMDVENIKRARSMGRLPKQPENGMGFPGQEAWLNHFYPRLDTLFQYLPRNGLITLFDPHRAESVCEKMKNKFRADMRRFREEATEKGAPFPEIDGILVPFEEMTRQFEGHQRLELSQLDLTEKDMPHKVIRIKGRFLIDDDLDVRLPGRGRVSMSPLAEKITSWLQFRSKVVLVCRTKNQADRLIEILKNYGVTVDRVVESWAEIPERPGLSVCLGRLSKGFTWPDLGLYVVSEDEVFGPKKARAGTARKARERALTWSGFSQLKAGDFVVHEEHGIGRYGDLTKMEIAQKVNDFVIIEYANNDRLYIPADRISILQKYVGAEERDPKLDRLGGQSWDIAKKRAKKSVMAIAKQLVEMYALRKYRKGFAFSPPDNYYREFEATFEHEETPDQVKAIEDVLEDMASNRPMDRLICGDVGFGKTEVALRAAFKAISDGKQVAVLVPTTVLAEQHYDTFKKRMEPYHVRLGIVSRFKTKKEQAEVLAKLRSAKIDILVGTHRMLQKDVKFMNLGLLIIDEEQRFGVKQKEALKKYRALVDVLAITATPVPRTLHMSMMGVRDLSIIETPPEDRFAIKSYLSPYDESLIKRALQFELERGGQIFFVHNRVQTIEHMADKLRQLVPQARFAVAHGRMKEKELEATMMRFIHKKIDVLVCTTIIEAGLDIPSANTIIINEVDRLGLAQVYQLRGRVGRSKEKARAFLLFSNSSGLTKDAEKRLKALMDFSHLGAGLHLAMHDLKIRGGGNILGFAQSGQISAIGYELYLKLIEKTTAELKGEEWHEDINPEINVDMTAFLPPDYVIDTDVRLNLYRRLSNLREKEDLNALEEEIHDRFGPPPQEVKNLLGVMSIRILLKKVGITRLDAGRHSLSLTFSQDNPVDPEALVRLVSSKPGMFQFLAGNKLKVNTGFHSLSHGLHKIEKTVEGLDLL
ncbi:MAG: transcription-repair coupling factor [Deltaproteobacteria bacterium]|nr:transcription-repair coupling factor [Deltaproteobacteria bacterium]